MHVARKKHHNLHMNTLMQTHIQLCGLSVGVHPVCISDASMPINTVSEANAQIKTIRLFQGQGGEEEERWNISVGVWDISSHHHQLKNVNG